mmetsp:Transcript_29514/g.73632  ORF Transcript_29514/g.73632 Transcript_29514/m.73632 type:complete len:212 (-) Transcript_29514:681-1316(-)
MAVTASGVPSNTSSAVRIASALPLSSNVAARTANTLDASVPTTKLGASNPPVGGASPPPSSSPKESNAPLWVAAGVKDTEVIPPPASPSNHATSRNLASKKRTLPSAPPLTRWVGPVPRAPATVLRKVTAAWWIRRILMARRSLARIPAAAAAAAPPGATPPLSHTTMSPSAVPVTHLTVPPLEPGAEGVNALTVKSPTVCLKSRALTGGE